MASQAQEKLNNLGRNTLVRDDSGPFRVYRDDAGSVFHSVTHILKETAPEWQQQALERWLSRPTASEDRDMAAKRGTLAHDHAERLLRVTRKLAIQTATKRKSLKPNQQGLERCPPAITSWALDKAIQSAPRVAWSASGYARGLRGWIEANLAAIHAIEFSIHHPLGFAGTADALLEVKDRKGLYVVDWKTSVRERNEDMLQNYIDQCGAYSLGLREMTGIQAAGALIVVARRTGAPQVRELSALELLGAETRFKERVERYFASLVTERPEGHS
jgi:ATP-dependent exoDNAse (exonuclease V) beta subunit